MAIRTQQQIFDQSVAYYVAQCAGAGITIDPTKWSAYNIQRLLHWSVAGAIAIFEQIFAAFTTNAELVATNAPPQSFQWIRKQMLLFQYDVATPQIAVYDPSTDTFIYQTINTLQRIITNCSVTSGLFGTTTIKVAKGGTTPAALTSPELDAAQSYANTLTVPGINYNVISLAADKLYAAITVKYLGQYSAIIHSTVVAAIEAYLLGIGFNGSVTMDDLLQAVKSVPGVTECILNNVQARADATAYGSGINMVSGNTWVQNSFQTISGYCVGETDSGHTLNDSIIYIPV